MDAYTVTNAVNTLREHGETPSVRKIQKLIGGSFRDITYHLKTLVSTWLKVIRHFGSSFVASIKLYLLYIGTHNTEKLSLRHLSGEERAMGTPETTPVLSQAGGAIAQAQAALARAARAVDQHAMPRTVPEYACERARTKLEALEQRREELLYHLPRLQRELEKVLAQEGETEQHIAFEIRSSWRAQRYPQEAEHQAREQRAGARERVEQWRRAIAEATAELARLDGSTQDVTSTGV